jgi:hypothetical protein
VDRFVPHRAESLLRLRSATLLVALGVGCATDPSEPAVRTAQADDSHREAMFEPDAEPHDLSVRAADASLIGDPPPPDPPTQVVPQPPVAIDWEPAQDCQIAGVAVGGSHACARTSQGHVYCWGSNYSQQLGAVASGHCTLGAFEFPCSAAPLPVAGLHDVVELALSNSDSCALDRAGRVRCWGASQSRIFEDGSRCIARGPNPVPNNLTCSASPAIVAGLETVTSIGGWGTQCAAQQDGTVKCWVAHMGPLPTPVPDVIAAVQTDFQCARTREGKVQCWWCNDLGLRGDGTLGPAQQLGVASNCQLTTSTVDWPGKAVDMASGYDHACLVDESGAVACWGDARAGALGVPASKLPICNYDAPCATRPLPMPGVGDALRITAGYRFTCLLHAQGDVSCTTAQGALVRIALPARALQIAGRYSDACAVLRGGRVFCWQPGAAQPPHEIVFCASGAKVSL